jgi:uncharacterized membrane protein
LQLHFKKPNFPEPNPLFMSNDFYLRIGRLFFAIAVLAIGIIHFVNNHFPPGLLPVPDTLDGRGFLVLLSGAALTVSGIMMLTDKFRYWGAALTAAVLLVYIAILHFPNLVMQVKAPNNWTALFEILSIFAGALIVQGNTLTVTNANRSKALITAGSYIFAVSLFVFGVQHYMYAQFIANLITSWIPGKLFWSYFVMVVFFAVGISIIIRKFVTLSTSLIGLMFILWVLILHLPRVIANNKSEAEWTSLFVALAMSGIAFLIAGLGRRVA